MRRFIRFFPVRLNRLLFARLPIRVPTSGRILACLSILGLVALSYLFGAAAMHFQLPSSDFLYQAFTGARAWHERGKSVIRSGSPGDGNVREGVSVDKPDQTYDGFTLYTTAKGSRATLLDMAGKVVHEWEMPFSQAWPRAPHVRFPLDDDRIHWFRCHLYANGDLLAIYHADGDTPYGYGLVKLDKDSKLLWAYAGHAHHDLDVGQDGTIYTLSQKLQSKAPAGLDYLPTPYIADSLLVLSSDGRELENIPLADCFRDSAYSGLFFASITEHTPPAGRPGLDELPDSPDPPEAKGDLFHANSVKVLRPAQAGKFPLFRPGQVLISLRHLHTLAVLDIPKRSMIWAARGMWRIQHDAEFLDNGHLLLFDNFGSTKGCRVIEYDPVTQAVPWIYSSEDSTPFNALFRGMKQRLPNGNTLIVDPDNGRLLEVTPSKELVWESFCPRPVTSAQRHGSDELTFLNGKARARP
jgi:hypothetical protein